MTEARNALYAVASSVMPVPKSRLAHAVKMRLATRFLSAIAVGLPRNLDPHCRALPEIEGRSVSYDNAFFAVRIKDGSGAIGRSIVDHHDFLATSSRQWRRQHPLDDGLKRRKFIVKGKDNRDSLFHQFLDRHLR